MIYFFRKEIRFVGLKNRNKRITHYPNIPKNSAPIGRVVFKRLDKIYLGGKK